MLFAGFSVSNGDLTLFGIVAAGVLGNLVGSWIAYAVGYYGRLDLLEKNQPHPRQPQAPEMGRRLVRALRRRHRLLRPDAADRPHLHLAAGRRRQDALLALHRLTLAGCIPWVLMLGAGRRSGRRQLGGVAPQPRLPRLRGASPRSSAGVVYLIVRRRAAGRRDPEPRRRTRRDGIPPRRALALGVVQGPAELLPVSSSAHIVLLPWLAGWDWDELDPELRKSFEVALHAGAAAALLIGQRQTIAEELRAFDRRRGLVLVLSFLPAAVVGYGLERQIEQRLGGPRATAVGLLAGAAAMLVADTPAPAARARRGRPRRRPGARRRPGRGAGARRLPQRRDPGRRALARLLPRPGEPALADGRAADHRRRHRCSRGCGSAAAASTPELRRSMAIGIGRLLRLDPRLAAADPPGRARPRALALRRLPGRPRRRRSCEAATVSTLDGGR